MSYMKYKPCRGILGNEDELHDYNMEAAIHNYKEAYHKMRPTEQDIYECKKAQSIILMGIVRDRYTLTKVK